MSQTITIITVSEKGDREEQVIMTNEALRQLLRGVRDQALQEAIDVCDMWRKEVERDYKGEKKQAIGQAQYKVIEMAKAWNEVFNTLHMELLPPHVSEEADLDLGNAVDDLQRLENS
jgi:hypothetical protein